MRRLSLTLAFLLAPTIAFAQSLAGNYEVWGRNVDGEVYTGEAEVRDDGEAITMFWNTTIGDFSGTGLRTGNTVLVDWGSDYLIFFTVMSDGELHGTWADGFALEKLTPR